MLTNSSYNPDVLSCLANLSSDEVFTPPSLANEMLDLLPEKLWSKKDAKFLDPVCKSGVFLREIAKRLLKGLEKEIPDLQKRIDHIFHNQIYGIAITELTGLLARRSVYCSKKADGEYSIAEFETEQGNILFVSVSHKWKNSKCEYCGGSQGKNDRGEELETHAYQFIHTEKPENIFNMKFDVIIGNPPYQLDTGGSGRQATPIYHYFVEQARKLNPRFLVMITPSRWFAGGMGLGEFREEMLNDRRLRAMTDFVNAKDCFQGISISGGVNYFLWERDYSGKCEFTSVHDGKRTTDQRFLNEFPVLVRYNEAVSILRKVKKLGEASLSNLVSPINPFGFATSERGETKASRNSITLHSSKGVGYVGRDEVLIGLELVDKYKVMVSQTISEHAGEPGKDGTFKLLSTVKMLPPGEICTFSYIAIGSFDSEVSASNLKGYLETKFARFLILQAVSSIHLSKEKFQFLPVQDFSKNWTDDALYRKYSLTEDEISLIDSMMRPIQTELF